MTKNRTTDFEQLREKYKLPSYAKLDNAFEISTLEGEPWLLREIVRKLSEQIDNFAKVIEDVLQPETQIAQMREAGAFDEQAKNDMYELYKKLRHLFRQSHEVILDGTDASCAGFINGYFSIYPDIKQQMVNIIRAMAGVWETEKTVQNDLGYMG